MHRRRPGDAGLQDRYNTCCDLRLNVQVSLEFAFLLGGLVVTEQVFNLNGLGMLFVEAISHRDYTLTQALVLLVATFFLFVNFFVDIAYGLIDPRIRYR